MNGQKLKLALEKFDSKNERDTFVNDALLAAASPQLDRHAEDIAVQIRGIGTIGGRDLLFKLWLYLEDRDMTDLLGTVDT